MKTVAIVDDNEMLREHMAERLKNDFQVIFHASSAKALFRFIRANEQHHHPNVVLMDIEMDEINGIEATAQLKNDHPEIKIIMLTVFEDEEKVLNAIKAGADGYMIKDDKRERIIESIHDVINGGSYLSPSIAMRAMKYLQKAYTPEKALPGNPLSKREQEILQAIIDGNSYAEIASSLFISLSTIKSHLYHIYQKLHVRNKMDAAKKVSGNKWL